MIEFCSLTLRDREWVMNRMSEDDRQACEYTFANNYLWSEIYNVSFARVRGCLVLRFEEGNELCDTIPIGAGDRRGAMDLLLAEAREQGRRPTFGTLVEKDLRWLEQNYPGQYQAETSRDVSDYIYLTEKLSTLSGRKLHGKRNHIARFKDKPWMYRDMMPEDAGECMRLLDEWKELEESRWNAEMENELHMNRKALRYLAELVLDGGMLYQGQRLVAFSIGEPLNTDTYVVHIEKALSNVQGAYPMINQQFVLRNCQGYKYVNREEDTGNEGLRKAKLSYGPEFFVEKYQVRFLS